MELVFPPPIDQPISQFVGQCSSLCAGKNSLSEQFICLLKCDNPQVSGHARNLLPNISQFAENKDAMRELGLFEELVKVFDPPTPSNPPMLLGLIAGVATLVADCPPNQGELLNTDFLDKITPIFSSLEGDSQEQCLRIILHLAKNQTYNQRITFNTELLESVFACLPVASSKTYTLSVEYILSIALGLAENELNANPLLETSAGGKLVDYFSSPVLDLRLYALKAGRLLAESSPEWKNALVNGGSGGIAVDGALPALIPQLKSKNDSILQLSLFIIRFVTQGANDEYEESADRIRNKLSAYAPHILPVVLSLIQPSSRTENIVKLAYMALTDILEIEKMQEAFVNEKGIKTLIQLALDSKISPEISTASSTLFNSLLSNNERILSQFIEEKELVDMINKLNTVSNDKLKEMLLVVLSNALLCSEELRDQLFESKEALQTLLSFLRSSDENCKCNAFRAAINLSLSYHNIPMLLDDELNILDTALNTMKEASSSSSLALSLLINLTANEETHSIIKKKANGLDWVVDLLKSSSETKQLAALKLITNLSTKGRNRKWFHEESEVPSLIQNLQNSSNESIKSQAESGSSNLSFPFEKHYDSEEVENEKNLPEIVEIDEKEIVTSSVDSHEAEEEANRLAKELEEHEAENQRIKLEQEKLEQERIREEEEEKAKLEQQRKEEESRIEKQKQDEQRLKEMEEQEKKIKEEQERKAQIELEQKKKEEEELRAQEEEAEAIRKQIEAQKEIQKQEEIRKEKQIKLEQLIQLDKQKEEEAASTLEQIQAKIKSTQENIEKISTRMETIEKKRNMRQQKLSKSLQKSQQSQSKLNESLQQSSPKSSARKEKHEAIIAKADEAKKRLRRADKTIRVLTEDRKELEIEQTKAEGEYENFLLQQDQERKERGEEIKKLQSELDDGGSLDISSSRKEELKQREEELQKLQQLRKERAQRYQEQEKEQEQQKLKFQKEREELEKRIAQQKQEEIEIRNKIEQQAEEKRKKIEAAKQELENRKKEIEKATKEANRKLQEQKEKGTMNSLADAARKKTSARRTNIAREIYDTEKSYVASLRTLVWKFQKPLQQQVSVGKTPVIATTEEIRTLFSNVEIILNFQKILLDGIEQRLKNWSDEQLLGDIFVKLTDYLRIYVDYVNNFDNAITLTTTKKKSKDKNFATFISKTERVPACKGLSFESFLIMPVQRVPRYVMLLMDLLKNTWKDHPDYQNLEVSLKKMQDIGAFINESKRQAEAMEKMHSILTSLTGKIPHNFINPQRFFIKEDLLKWKGNFNAQVFLLTDIILVTKPMRNSMFDCKQIVSIAKSSVRNVKSDQAFKLSTTTNEKKIDFLFICPNTGKRDEWVSAINKQIEKVKSNL